MVKRELKMLSIAFAILLTGCLVYSAIEVWKLPEGFQTLYLKHSIHPAQIIIERKGGIQEGKKQPSTTYTVKDAALANELFTSLLSLEDAPKGPISCPADYGITYSLSFYQNNKMVYQATANSGGCQFIKLPHRIVSSNQHFWTLMQQATGLNSKQLWGDPNQS